ncbi:hypothetical protein Tco_1036293 [Tanacetum coccineum]
MPVNISPTIESTERSSSETVSTYRLKPFQPIERLCHTMAVEEETLGLMVSWYQEPMFLIKMFPRRSEGEELEYPFFEGDGSSFDEWRDYGMSEVVPDSEIPEVVFSLLEEFSDVFPDELHGKGHVDRDRSTGLSPFQVVYSTQPRGPLDLMYLHVFGFVPKELHDFVEGLPYHGDSSNDDLVENSRTNFVYPWGNDAGPSVEERAFLFLEAQDCVKKKPLFKVT